MTAHHSRAHCFLLCPASSQLRGTAVASLSGCSSRGCCRGIWWPHLCLSLTQCKESDTGNLLAPASFLLGFPFLPGILSHLLSQLTTGSRSLREWSFVHPTETLYSSMCAFFFSAYEDVPIFTICNGKFVSFHPSYCEPFLPYHRPLCLVATQCFIWKWVTHSFCSVTKALYCWLYCTVAWTLGPG